MAQIQLDLKASMLSRQQVKSQTLKSILSELKYAAKSSAALSQSDQIEIVQRMIKKRQMSIEEFKKAGRQDLIDMELEQLEVVNGYLPAQLSQVELEAVVQDVIKRLNVTSPKEMSRVVKETRETISPGSASAALVAQVVSKLLRK